jgi:hypothetical protein
MEFAPSDFEVPTLPMGHRWYKSLGAARSAIRAHTGWHKVHFADGLTIGNDDWRYYAFPSKQAKRDFDFAVTESEQERIASRHGNYFVDMIRPFTSEAAANRHGYTLIDPRYD